MVARSGGGAVIYSVYFMGEVHWGYPMGCPVGRSHGEIHGDDEEGVFNLLGEREGDDNRLIHEGKRKIDRSRRGRCPPMG